MPHEYRNLLFETTERAVAYLESSDSRPVFPASHAIEALHELGGRLPERGEGVPSVLERLDRFGSPATVATTGSRYFGFVVGGALPATVAAHWLADAWDQNASQYVVSPVGAFLEEVALEWLLDLLRLPSTAGGGFVTGGQMANFTCLAAARHRTLQAAGWDVENDGMFGAPPIEVIVGEESHVTLFQALAMLGLGRQRVTIVPADDQGRIRPSALPHVSGPAIVCTQVGNVNTGGCDAVGEVCRAAREMGAWVHVDGAFGLWARASTAKNDLVDGVDQADSWAVDAHKWLNVPQDSGIAIVREPDALKAAMSMTAAYLTPSRHRDPMQWTPEASRRARGVEIWTALRTLGREGVADLVDRTCRYASAAAAHLKRAGFEVLNDVVLNQVLISFGSAETTTRVVRAVQEDGTCWCGATIWKGRTAMRISVSSWKTTDEDLEKSLDAIVRIARVVIGKRDDVP